MSRAVVVALLASAVGAQMDGCVDTACSPNARAIYSASSESCVCECIGYWEGAPSCTTCKYGGKNCDECKGQAEINFPACDLCRVSAHCSNHATEVYRLNENTCGCKCSNQWSGPDCSVCPPEFDAGYDCGRCNAAKAIGTYPKCIMCDANYCGGHLAADAQPTLSGGKCNCPCRNRYEGNQCESCADGFDESGRYDCDVCQLEWIDGVPTTNNLPTCIKCTTSHPDMGRCTSGGITSNRKDKCICKQCQNGYEGDTCNSCSDGFIEGAEATPQDPKCKQCDPKVCNNHADRISSNKARTVCECHCSNGYEGAACDQCIEGWRKDGTSCIQCTSQKDCKNRAVSVSSDSSRSKCVCKECRNQWEESAQCGTCPSEFGGGDCNMCDETRIGYPSCTEVCDLTKHCSGRATHVLADSSRTKCVCECTAQYEGYGCEKCAAGYKGSPPNCAKCIISTDCVEANTEYVSSDNSRQKCTCKCLTGYEGERCENCANGYYKSGSKCKKCTSAEHCFGNARSVKSNSARTGCDCNCRNKWEVSTSCKTCPAAYEAVAGDCDRCKSGYTDFPNCRKCDLAADCNNHGVRVYTDNSRKQCLCECAVGYEGESTGCDRCADGYYGYPECKKCDKDAYCYGRAVSIRSDPSRTRCICTCNSQFEGERCDMCAAGYIGEAPPTPGTDTCEKCTNDKHCFGRGGGEPMDDGTRSKCMCTCRNYWMETTNCETCNATYTGSDCDKCASPTGVLPTCNACNVQEHCNGHAGSVVYEGGSCKCMCEGNWNGEDCNDCPGQYNRLAGCVPCTDDLSCNNHGRAIVTPSGQCMCEGDWNCPNYTVPYDPLRGDEQACYCRSVSDTKSCPCGVVGCRYYGGCHGMWKGHDCNVCPPQYLQNGDRCHECQSDRVGYPRCARCEEEWDRWGCDRNRAMPVPDRENRYCDCQCHSNYESPPHCNRCNYGYINYPNCRACDNADCNENAVSWGSNQNRTACTCKCKAGYQYGEKWGECSCCSPGYFDEIRNVDRPKCTLCTMKDHCSGHAIEVTDDGMRTGCNCTCYAQWEDHFNTSTNKVDKCGYCDTDRFAGDCDRCAPGRVYYPYCFKCSVESHCNGNALTVKSDDANLGCICECKDYWGGPGGACKTCPEPYGKDTGGQCKVCKDPALSVTTDCDQRCTSHKDCNNRAFEPVYYDDEMARCDCKCRNHYIGEKCDVCPPKYGGADCDQCGLGYFQKDGLCTPCTNEGYCHGRARMARPTGDQCVCEVCSGKWTGQHCNDCSQDYAGSNCDRCADGYHGYPNCVQCDMNTLCQEGRAQGMVTNGDSCVCDCLPSFTGDMCKDCSGQWEGNACNMCPKKYGGDNCNECAPGYAEYPTCRACQISDCPNGVADYVTSDGQYCVCVCNSNSCGAYGSCRMPGVARPLETERPAVQHFDGSPTVTLTLTETETISTTDHSVTPTETLFCPKVSLTKTLTLEVTEVKAGAASVEDPDDGSSLLWLWLLLFAGLLCSCCLVLAVFLMRKKRNEGKRDPNASNNLMSSWVGPPKEECVVNEHSYDPEPVVEDDVSMGSVPATEESLGGVGNGEDGEDPLLEGSDDDDRMDV
eukprot:TRINITY_DN16393_c0_g1_i1.p1 TRINITY_DN16393_c0_g1~~TRINITY_DN16393_c0_g1_i1.p1  ORF type:complete len:1584 (+),score=400.53 TRINITY_DN16393_c0_g1_i1:93-4844(+)